MELPINCCNFCSEVLNYPNTEDCFYCDGFFKNWKRWRKLVRKTISRVRNVRISINLHLHEDKRITQLISKTVRNWVVRKNKVVDENSRNHLFVDLRTLTCRMEYPIDIFKGNFRKTKFWRKKDIEKKILAVSRKFNKCDVFIHFTNSFGYNTNILAEEPCFIEISGSKKIITEKVLRKIFKRAAIEGLQIQNISRSNRMDRKKYMGLVNNVEREIKVYFQGENGLTKKKIFSNNEERIEFEKKVDISKREIIKNTWEERLMEVDQVLESS